MRSAPPRLTRRVMLKAAGAALTAGFPGLLSAAEGPGRRDANAVAPAGKPSLEPPRQEHKPEKLPPVRQITRGPKFHWFAYYDKLQFDPACRYALGMEVGFEHRSPGPDDVIRVGMVDLEDRDRWIELGTSRAWCWQQGCMLQWRPGSETEVLWNDRQGDAFVCHILDVKTGKRRTIPHPVYAVSPDGRWAVAPDFRRVNDCRPGYGYAGLPDPNRDVLAPADSGLFRVDLETGRQELLITLANVVKIPYAQGDITKAKHWFNHLLINPDGTRFEFLHRWRVGNTPGFTTRMFTAAPDGTDLRVIDPSGSTSHFIWRDPQHILAWSWHACGGNAFRPWGDAFYLFEDKAGGKVEIVGRGVMTVNGHCTYLPGNTWILNDTYPQGKERLQSPYLYHVATGKRVWLGHFALPKQYSGEWRCDTHPRFSPDGRSVVIDSPHTGQGRQMFLIDVSGIVGKDTAAGRTVPVSGIVTYEDGSLIQASRITVVFVSTQKPPPRPSVAIVNPADGSFSQATTFVKGDGILAGEYVVVVRATDQQGRPIDEVPKDFTDPTTTPLRVHIREATLLHLKLPVKNTHVHQKPPVPKE
jgi:hypothetical protein